MAWERRGGNVYYYQKRRQGHQVTSEYVGGGCTAQLASALDMAERERKRRHLDQRNQQAAELDLVERNIRCLSSGILAVVEITLLAAGFHCHKGQWRKVRNG